MILTIMLQCFRNRGDHSDNLEETQPYHPKYKKQKYIGQMLAAFKRHVSRLWSTRKGGNKTGQGQPNQESGL